MKKIIVVMFFMLACGLTPNIQRTGSTFSATQIRQSNPTSIVTQAARASVNSSRQVLWRDDFSDVTSGWGSLSVPEGSAGYDNGRYVIQVDSALVDLYANPGQQFSGGVALEVTATKISGSDNNNFGLLCRYQDPSNYYYFVISNDGFFAIFRILDGETTYVGVEGWLESSSIHTGGVSNVVRVECVGNALRLFANGSLLIAVQDNTFASGDVGLIAGTFDVPGTIIAFDNFVVYAQDE